MTDELARKMVEIALRPYLKSDSKLRRLVNKARIELLTEGIAKVRKSVADMSEPMTWDFPEINDGVKSHLSYNYDPESDHE